MRPSCELAKLVEKFKPLYRAPRKRELLRRELSEAGVLQFLYLPPRFHPYGVGNTLTARQLGGVIEGIQYLISFAIHHSCTYLLVIVRRATTKPRM